MKNNAFALVETLIVTLFVMTIFTLIFTSFYPLVGKYEAAEDYDSLDGKYIAHYYRKQIVKNGKDSLYTLNDCNNTCKELYSETMDIGDFCYNNYDDKEPTSQSFCINYPEYVGIKHIYLTNYNITNFNTYAQENLDRGLYEYLNTIPVEDKNGYYRLIVEYVKDSETEEMAFATIEVKK